MTKKVLLALGSDRMAGDNIEISQNWGGQSACSCKFSHVKPYKTYHSANVVQHAISSFFIISWEVLVQLT